MEAARVIEGGGKRLAIFLPNDGWKEGLTFLSHEADFIQVGLWGYNTGQRLGPHIHNHVPREAVRTQEVVYVRQGRVMAHIFDEQQAPVATVEMMPGDVLILLAGGHGFEVLEENTLALEVKNGPYSGPEVDRRRFEWKS